MEPDLAGPALLLWLGIFLQGLRCFRFFQGGPGHLFGDALGRLPELADALAEAAAQLGQLLGSEDHQSGHQDDQQFPKADVENSAHPLLAYSFRMLIVL